MSSAPGSNPSPTATMTGSIRPLERRDHGQWLELWRGYQQFYGADLRAGEEELFERLLAPSPEGPFCLVFDSGEGALLGMTQFLYHGTTWSSARRCYLNDLFTRKEARGQRIGEKLIGAVGERAAADGCEQVYWLTQEGNTSGRKLYDRVAKVTDFIKYRL